MLSEPQVDLENERCWPQRFAGPKTAKLAARKDPELVINKAEELVDSSVVTLPPTCEGTIDVIVVVHPRAQRRLWWDRLWGSSAFVRALSSRTLFRLSRGLSAER
jgi:hypothetical protein